MASKKQPKLLIIEDDPYTSDIYFKVFAENGFDVIIFPDADGYFAERVVECAPDIISMDIMIGKNGKPGERDGLEALELLKGDLRTHEIPIFILSNFFQEAGVKKARDLGAVDYLNSTGLKPSNVPSYYLNYLRNPKKYVPSHPLFKKEQKKNIRDISFLPRTKK